MRILVATDFSKCAKIAVENAIFHAKIMNAELHMLHCVVVKDKYSLSVFPPPDKILKTLQDVARVHMEESYELDAGELKIVEKINETEDPSQEICRYADEHQCDLIFMGTHGYRFIDHFYLGSVAENVARNAPCPVMTFHPVNEGDQHLKPIRKIMVSVDFSSITKTVVDNAVEMAKMHNAELDLVHIVEDYFFPIGLEGGFIAPAANVMDLMVSKRETQLEKQLELSGGLDIPHACHTKVGRLPSGILEWVKNHEIDLVVMGTHGYGGLSHLILGSVAERVIRLADCPVMVIKQKEEE